MSNSCTIAIQPDHTLHRNGQDQSYSRRWLALAREHGIQAREVDLFRNDWLEQIDGCMALMWRCNPSYMPRRLAKLIIPALEHSRRMLVFPDWRTIWHHEDKLAQRYLLEAAGIPVPKTAILWSEKQALEFCKHTDYPFVLKLASGYQSSNVKLVRNFFEAEYWVNQLFRSGLVSTGYLPTGKFRQLIRRMRAAAHLVAGKYPNSPTEEAELAHGYFLAQEYLPGNSFDVRITIIGDRAFGLRRCNRPDDFRASGSGIIDFDPTLINQQLISLAFKLADLLELDTVAVDGLYRNGEAVICEIGSAYAAWAIESCPGHWRRTKRAGGSSLHWEQGSCKAEDALFDVFLEKLKDNLQEL